MHNCNFISSCTIMYVCSNDLNYNVLWGRYASELKGLMKKLLFSILHISMQNCKSIVAMVFECYFFITVVMYVHACIMHYNVMMMSVTRNKRKNYTSLYFPGGSPVSMQNFRSTDYMIYLFFDINMACIIMYCLIIIIFSRSKRVKGKIICLCSSSDENLFKSGSKLLWLLRYASS